MKRTASLLTCAGLALSSFALIPAAQAAPKGPAVVRSSSAVKPVGTGETSVSLTLAQTASQKATTRSLASKRGHNRTAFASTQPAVAHRDAVLSWASANGFRVVHSSRFLVTVVGQADRLATALGSSVKQDRGYTVPVSAPTVPAELKSHVESVVGLDNRPAFRRHAAFGPADVRAMSNTAVKDSTAGSGVTVGTVNYSGWYPEDLDAFASDPEADGDPSKAISVAPGQITEVSVDGTPTAGDDGTGGSAEVALDAEAILATAPAAKQRLYFGDNSEAGTLAIWDKMASDAQAGLLHVVSTSWGTCEANYDDFPAALNAEVARIDTLVAAGVTVFAASGDYGAYDCSDEEFVDNTVAVDFPASHPRVVGVGGTTTEPGATPGTYVHEAWGPALVDTSPDPLTFQGTGSGGGHSAKFLTGPAGQPASATPGRQVPDIAALADPSTGLIVYIDGYGLAGGTSLAAPLSAAGLATVLGKTSPVVPMGNILPTLYANPSVVHDVVGNGNGYYAAGAGYDHVTGLGTMDWTAFAALVSTTDPGVTVPAFTRSTTVPVSVVANAAGYTSWGVAEGTVTSCAGNNLSSAPTSVVISGTQGLHTITVTALDTKSTCHTVSRSVTLDSVAPSLAGLKATYTGTTSPKFTVAWTSSDAAPSSGLGKTHLSLRDNTAAKTVYVLDTAASSAVLGAVAGHSYTVSVSATDKAGGTSPVAATSFSAPTDDKAFAFSGFVRQNNTQDYMGSHAVAVKAGSYAKFTFTGKLAWVGVVKSRSCGYMDVYVDGVRKARVNLYSATTKFRQQIRVATFSTVGKHTVVLKAVGAHQAGATSSNIYADSLTVA